jgi:hypothetical protein
MELVTIAKANSIDFLAITYTLTMINLKVGYYTTEWSTSGANVIKLFKVVTY